MGTQRTSINMLWLRRDLQLEDNAALHNALKENVPIQPVFIFDTDILSRFKNKQDRRLSFIAAALVNLHSQLSARGGGLLILHGRPEEIIPRLASLLGSRVFAGEDYEPGTKKRDKNVGKEVELHLFKQHVLLSPDEVLKDDGTAFKVYTPFSKKWRAKLKENDHLEYEIKDKGRYADFSYVKSAAVRTGLTVITPENPKIMLADIGYEYKEDDIWIPESADKRLKAFIENRLTDYENKRDFPADDGTSALSPYLRFGLLTIRQLYNAAIKVNGSEKWISELIWREFYITILSHYPKTPHEEFQEQYRNLEWRYDKSDIEAWKAGKTGYPIVDAGMRQLLQTGWMHNRVRMIVASFLTKDLLIDWRVGEEHFAQYLMDYELASNVGGWQWASSTGTDAAPYFRIFNPLLQSKKFDPKGQYIRSYIPELAGLTDGEIHEPNPLMRPSSYPQPIIDHEKVRPRVMKLFKKN